MNVARKFISATLLLSGIALCLGQTGAPMKATSPATASSPGEQ
jgi:hypothetical protein